MSRIALIRNNTVENVIEASLEFALTLGYDHAIESETAGPGWLYENGELVAPPAPDPAPIPDGPSPLTKLSFLRRFTLSERIAMTNSEDSIIQDGLLMLQVAENFRVDDPDTVALVHYMEQEGYITEERVSEILSP